MVESQGEASAISTDNTVLPLLLDLALSLSLSSGVEVGVEMGEEVRPSSSSSLSGTCG